MDSNDNRLKYCIRILLPPEYSEHTVNLQPIEVKNLLSFKTFNEDITNIVNPAELHAKPHTEYSTFPDKIKNTNQTDNLCTQIRAYIDILSKQAKFIVPLNSCRISNGLLVKKNRL